MRQFIYLIAVCSLAFNIGRLLDIAWPTKRLDWKFYAALAAIWACAVIVFTP